jgi:SAM-dependent methyltransferase
MLSREEARSFYNRFGKKQDWQRFYEGPAIKDLLAHGAFERARAVLELGCGTGAFAERLLSRYLSKEATYLCLDVSSTMVSLAKARLRQYGPRTGVCLTDGSPKLPLPDSRFDRFIAPAQFFEAGVQKLEPHFPHRVLIRHPTAHHAPARHRRCPTVAVLIIGEPSSCNNTYHSHGN